MAVNRLKRHKLVYLAVPYEGYLQQRQTAYKTVLRASVTMAKNNVCAISPLLVQHPAIDAGFSIDAPIWLRYAEAYMDSADALGIIDLARWEDSDDVDFAIDYMRRDFKPVYLIQGAYTSNFDEAVVWEWDEFSRDCKHLEGR